MTATIELPTCADCHRVHWPAMTHCPHCLGGDVRIEPHSATGTVLATTELHHTLDAAFRGRLPWAVALVRLDSGVSVLVDKVGPAHARESRIDVQGVDHRPGRSAAATDR
ncbi:MAG: OB-fold domain-containing protein [Burkholderiales bacterium]|jgi:uncharacterized OB-fold protein|nr:OB-fold domain-containing protein [Burkholderiales bacterium]